MPWKKGQSGNPEGVQRGTRHALNQAFLKKLSEDWRKHGDDVIAAAREKDPVGYMRVIASLMPKDLRHLHEPSTAFTEMLERVNHATKACQSIIDVTAGETIPGRVIRQKAKSRIRIGTQLGDPH
jgi:hypothetical protein